MSGAWNGNTFHTVMLEPQNGIETTLYPFIPDPDPAGQFQPMALIVPYENGTKPALVSVICRLSTATRTYLCFCAACWFCWPEPCAAPDRWRQTRGVDQEKSDVLSRVSFLSAVILPRTVGYAFTII